MQNKANLLNAQMNVTTVTARDYENERLRTRPVNKANSNPIKPNLCHRYQSQFQTGHLLIYRLKHESLNFSISKNNLTPRFNSLKYRSLCGEREFVYEELYGKKRRVSE